MSESNWQTPWGGRDTRYFYELTPDRILDAVEAGGLRTTGRCMALNSMENRVYDVEIELDERPENPSDAFRVVKFYRPGRWSREQILEEHEFLLDLVEDEVPVIAPLEFPEGGTLRMVDDAEILYAVFPRIGGRIPEEPDEEMLRRMGRLIARVHNVGVRYDAPERVRLDAVSYGRDNLAYLLESGAIPDSAVERYGYVAGSLIDLIEPWIEETPYQRIHGDCHLGNILAGGQGLFLVDFDDMVRGPCVQDLWLIEGGKDDWALRRREILLEGYEQLRDFDRRTLRLIEPLRALRMIHFSAWIAKRWEDPAFPRVFSNFSEDRYWFEEISILTEQLGAIQEEANGGF